MELDHVDPSQKVDHRIWSWSKARMDVEVAKCQVLCYDCHLAKSVTEDHSETGKARLKFQIVWFLES
jgi:hypothetical protein